MSKGIELLKIINQIYMGQYYKNKKIGTCESMYYMRLSEAQELAKQGEADEDGIKFSRYLEDNQTKWRFPFPDEDEGIPANCEYNKSFTIPCPVDVEVSHDNMIALHHTTKDKSHGINIFLPCPYSHKFKDMEIETSYNGVGEQFLEVIMEGIRDTEDGKGREVKTIFECSRCGDMQRFSNEDIEKIKKCALDYYSAYDTTGKNPEFEGNQSLYNYAVKIIERIK